MCLAPHGATMDPQRVEASARSNRRKRSSNKLGKNATPRGGSSLPPRHPQAKRQSHRALKQQGSERLASFGSVPARQEQQRRNNRRQNRRNNVAYGKNAWPALWWPVRMPVLSGPGNVSVLSGHDGSYYVPGVARSSGLTPAFSTPGTVPPAPLNSTRLALAGMLKEIVGIGLDGGVKGLGLWTCVDNYKQVTSNN